MLWSEAVARASLGGWLSHPSPWGGGKWREFEEKFEKIQENEREKNEMFFKLYFAHPGSRPWLWFVPQLILFLLQDILELNQTNYIKTYLLFDSAPDITWNNLLLHMHQKTCCYGNLETTCIQAWIIHESCWRVSKHSHHSRGTWDCGFSQVWSCLTQKYKALSFWN